ncbi:polysaccharide deacetylase family protein [Paenibacillus sp. HB172176]|uniref:polysaccharide deacetylase family protein n=1 Tax=Paenibacillus sp. HB172176 TaxID=2493690 RepID=UPI001439CABA|nr:polysaccharide deacetylase family protein [Paenibacillus sp. HB172176]
MKIKFDRFAEGKLKAVVFSFDDGTIHDRRLVASMNQYGLRGTFHLNSGFFGKDNYIEAGEVASLFAGHEVSAHTVTHPFLDESPLEQIAEEILYDRSVLEALVGYPVRGMSYPFGTYNDQVLGMLPSLGIEYSRTVKSHGNFTMPSNWLEWHPTCHQKTMVEDAKRFVASQPKYKRKELFFAWGHSFEFDRDDNWELIDQVGEVLAEDSTIWYATMAELVAYTEAEKQLRFSVDRGIVHNPTALDIWFSVDGETVKAAAGRVVKL